MRAIRALGAMGALFALCSCYDFIEPDFPEAGAPAFLQADIFATERGGLNVEALLVPGLAIGGVNRHVLGDSLDILGVRLKPDSIRPNGTRVYHFSGAARVAQTQPLMLQAPPIEEINGLPPQIAWYPVQKTDPDTIVWTRGTDLLLHNRVVGVSTPTPPIRQWFLDIIGSTQVFHISSDGLPPTTLRVPPDFVPTSDSGIVTVTLTFYQAGRVNSPSGEYIANISFNFQVRWIVRVIGT